MHLNHSLLICGLAALASACSSGSSGGGNDDNQPGQFNVTYEAPSGSGFASGQLRGLRLRPALARDYDFTDGVTVSGIVTDGLGAPMPGVDIEFRTTLGTPEMADDTTDGLGAYSVTLAADTWIAELDSDDDEIGEMSVAGIVVAAPGPVTQDFQFAAVVAVTGTVFELGGPAIADAELEFIGLNTGAEVEVTADAFGAYTANLVLDTYDVVVTPIGAPAATHLEQTFRSIPVTAATIRDFDLMQGVQLSGVVLDEVGMPLLDDADIDVVLPEGSDFFEPDGVQASEVDGSYSIGPVPLGSVILEVEPSGDTGYPRQQLTRMVAGPMAQAEDLQLTAGVILSGTILMADMNALEDCRVRPMPTDGSLAPDDDRTDALGFFEISLLPGEYVVEIEPDDPADLQLPEMRTITVAGATTLDATLTAGVILTGTVTQPGGITPEENATVWIEGAMGAEDDTDGAGMYSFLAPIGTHDLSVEVDDGLLEGIAMAPETGIVVAAPGPVTHDFELVPSLTGGTVVVGFVYEPDGVTPVDGADIVARRHGEQIGRTLSFPDGSYVLVINE